MSKVIIIPEDKIPENPHIADSIRRAYFEGQQSLISQAIFKGDLDKAVDGWMNRLLINKWSKTFTDYLVASTPEKEQK